MSGVARRMCGERWKRWTAALAAARDETYSQYMDVVPVCIRLYCYMIMSSDPLSDQAVL